MSSLRLRAAMLLASVMAAACGSVDSQEMLLLTRAEWKDQPGSAAEIGFWISVDVGWPDRGQDCSPLPSSLRVTVNDREATQLHAISGDCSWDVVFEVGPFSPDEQPTRVRVLDGEKTLGEAAYDGLYPAYPAQLLSAADGRVRAGESFTMSMPASLSSVVAAYGVVKLFWLDPAPAIPPYYQFATIEPDADAATITVSAPSTTGRAAVIAPISFPELTRSSSCIGFASCLGQPNDNIGPVFVEVIP
jgi:hypothetical protein